MTARRTKYQGDPEAAAVHACAWPDCGAPAGYKAPRSKEELRDYIWFCLDHVREYNKSWNYYEGMDDAEVEAAVRSDTTWNRPSWPLGDNGRENSGHGTGPEKNGYKPGDFVNMRDPFGLFDDQAVNWSPSSEVVNGRVLTEAERRAVRVLGLDFPLEERDVKARYKELVKRYHPDANGGDRGAEEKFKQITGAYETVLICLVG